MSHSEICPVCPEFDVPAGIRELAEAEWECPIYPGISFAASGRVGPLVVVHPKDCPGGCGGAGRIVPFAALRVKCQGDKSLSPWTVILSRQHGNLSNNEYIRACTCGGRGWIPEPDVRVACWEIFENQPKVIGLMMRDDNPYREYEVKEAVIRAALAWLEEQHART